MRMASYLAENLAGCSILVLTDLSIIGRFKFPRNVDYVHLPAMNRQPHSHQYAGNLNIALNDALTIRRKILKSAVKTFSPDFFIVERKPFGPQEEMRRTLSFVRKHLPKTKLIWGLLDVVGDPEMIRRDWTQQDFYRMLEHYCDEIWIYGTPEIFDHLTNYQIPATIAGKCYYMSYLRSWRLASARMHKDIVRFQQNKKPYVLITSGSGAEGFTLVDTYLRFLEHAGESLPFHSLIVTGPMMRTHEKLMLKKRAQKLPGVIFHRFSKHVLQYVEHADLVISNGGYNTFCEILSYRKKSIFAPPFVPPYEHLLRAEIFHKLGMITRVIPRDLSAERLGDIVQSSLYRRIELAPSSVRVRIPLDGLDNIVERIEILSGLKPRAWRQAV
ncbi:MAG: hypothetical protein ONA90_03110 [candidate division KSB1 bacterium]|nr:hypothetical protein [candidate division KSB1 bacterium]